MPEIHQLLGYPTLENILLNKHFLGRVIWPGLVVVCIYIPVVVMIWLLWDPFPGHSLDFLLSGIFTITFMVIGANKRWLEILLITFMLTIASLNEFINFLPGPGARDLWDIVCYLGGALISYLGITLFRPWAVSLLFNRVIPNYLHHRKTSKSN